VQDLEALGAIVLAVPNVRRPGEAVALSARMLGLPVAEAEYVVFFDADCRLPHATAVLNWYVRQFRSGVDLAYTRLDLCDIRPELSVRARVMAFHVANWFKRVVLRIPTLPGPSFGIRRTQMQQLYEQGYLADEMNVGPTVKAKGGRIAYGGSRSLTVLQSGSHVGPGWIRLLRYLLYRLDYNMRVLPVSRDAARRTKRTHSTSGRRYAVFLEQESSQESASD
jgi:hypothetical protein